MSILDLAVFKLEDIDVTPVAPLEWHSLDNLAVFSLPPERTQWCWASVVLTVLASTGKAGVLSADGLMEMCEMAKDSFSECEDCSMPGCDQPEFVEDVFDRKSIFHRTVDCGPSLDDLRDSLVVNKKPVILKVKVGPFKTFHYIMIKAFGEREPGVFFVQLVDPFGILSYEAPLSALDCDFCKSTTFIK